MLADKNWLGPQESQDQPTDWGGVVQNHRWDVILQHITSMVPLLLLELKLWVFVLSQGHPLDAGGYAFFGTIAHVSNVYLYGLLMCINNAHNSDPAVVCPLNGLRNVCGHPTPTGSCEVDLDVCLEAHPWNKHLCTRQQTAFMWNKFISPSKSWVRCVHARGWIAWRPLLWA